MDVMSAMTGDSGWPANFFLTPDAAPLFATGYLAPEAEYGRPGFLDVVQGLARAWTTRRREILEDAQAFRAEIAKLAEATPAGAGGGEDPRARAAGAWSERFDETYGGFGWGAKFLHPNVLSFLLRHGVRRRDWGLLARVLETLDHMAAGGVRDQLGGAFHRYSVDRFWQVPHFEMALNDNALLARLYIEAYQASGKARYAAVARAILDDLLARFRLREGGFAAALDADSGGVEGAFYTWTEDEVRAALGAPEADLFLETYVDRRHGLVKGRSVLRLLQDPASRPGAQGRLAASRARLLAARQRRPAPARDEKVLTDWNALAVSAFAKAGQALDDPGYRRVAQEEGERLLAAAADDRSFSHGRLAGKSVDAVFLDDYAFLVEAALDLYESDFHLGRLERARGLMERLIERFQEAPGAPFRSTPLGWSGGIPARTVLDEDGAPSGNAAALSALHRLVLFGAEGALEDQARAVTRALGPYLESSGPAAPGLLQALDFSPQDSHEIVIVGRADDRRTQALLREVRGRLLPGTVVALIAPDAPGKNERWPLLAGRPLLDERPTAYLCRQRLCELPVDRPADLAARLDRLFPRAPAP
jgi:hypothetical protein